MSDPVEADGYSLRSIAVHWLTAIIVVALFFTHEAARGSLGNVIHVSGGAIAGVFLLWRVWHRARRGLPLRPHQPFIIDVASLIVLWGFLATIVVVVITGYFLPWSLGRQFDLFGMIYIPTPMAASQPVHEVIEEAHEISGYLFVPLLALHLLGAAKHVFIDKDGIVRRMFKPAKAGR
ncbi:MAG: hypothetical protein HKN11_02610 [Rhizobiales bacterium]|nr:hypothetical protein [Hyphomicrobiales bacterium]